MNQEVMNSGLVYAPFPLACTHWHENKQVRDSFCSYVVKKKKKNLHKVLFFQGLLCDFHQRISQRHFNVLRSLLLKVTRGTTILESCLWQSCKTIKTDVALNGFRFSIWLKGPVTASVTVYAFLIVCVKWVCCFSSVHWTNSHTVKVDGIK